MPGEDDQDGRRRSVPRWLRAVLPALVVPPLALAPVLGDGSRWNAATVLLVLAAAVTVALRLRFPRSAAAAAIGLGVVGLALQGPLVSLVATLMVTVFSAARHTNRRTAVVVAVAASTCVGTAAALLAQDWEAGRGLVEVTAWMGFAAAAGDATRSRAVYVAGITERARRAEESKESKARRRVAEERLRIARDLHDVLAHQIAVVNLHANVASRALPDRPEDAERSLLAIRGAARAVLGEIGDLLQVLRASDTESATPGTAVAPVPGLTDLDRLVADFGRSGLGVEVRTVGTPVPVPEAVGVAAYRIVQEALTNAHKHGDDASALLQVEHQPGWLELTVTNTAATARRSGPADVPGHGLLGARERAAAVRGELTTSWGPGSVHRLTARLPAVPPDEEPASLPEATVVTNRGAA